MSQKLDKRELFKRAQVGDEEALNILVKNNMRLVYNLSKKYRNCMIEFDDLVSFGTMGLLKAIQQFDVDYGTQFSTYAVPLILGEIKRYFRDDGAIKVARSMKELYFAIEKERINYEKEHENSPTLEYIADKLAVSYEEIVMALEAHLYPTSLETPLDEDNLILLDTIGFEEKEDILTNLDLQSAIESLKKKEQLFVKMRYFDGMKQTEIAERLFVSQVQISRLEKKVLQKLKQFLS